MHKSIGITVMFLLEAPYLIEASQMGLQVVTK